MQYRSEEPATCEIAAARQKEQCNVQYGADKSPRVRSRSCAHRLVECIETAREDERKNLARELHDGIGQQLLGLRAQAYAIDFELGESNLRINKATERMISAIDSTIMVVRNLMSDLREDPLAHGLAPALQSLASECTSRTGGTCNIQTQIHDRSPSEEVAECIFRIVQESLRNVVRHANAKDVSVQFAYSKGRYVLEVVDDGCGFVLNEVRAGALGLLGMHERAGVLNGLLSITSVPGKGTSIFVIIPAATRSRDPLTARDRFTCDDRSEAGEP
jgi:signal transduction histidine kinase